MIVNQHMETLKRLSSKVINNLYLLSGAPNPRAVNKVSKIESFLSQYHLYATQFQNLHKQNTLGIDVGFKNFSYCKTTGKEFPLEITKWEKLQLYQKFGTDYQNILQENSILDKQRYNCHIANELVSYLNLESCNVKIMEVQRTRSGGNLATLPIVQDNRDLERAIFGKVYPGILFPVEVNKMINYWVYAHVNQESKKKLTQYRKKWRAELVLSWYGKLYTLPGFKEQHLTKKGLLEFLDLDAREKIDDLIDSLLYNLYINSTFSNLKEFGKCLHEGNNDLTGVVEKRLRFHRDLLQPIYDKYELKWKDVN